METLHHLDANIPLVLCGFGFGLALPPINAAILASTDDDVHGLASAFVVVGRMVGMLVGISALTAIGLRRFYAAQEDNPLPPAREVCDGRTRCKDFSDLLAAQGIPQEHAVFAGAAVCAAIAAVLAVLVFRGVAHPRRLDSGPVALGRLSLPLVSGRGRLRRPARRQQGVRRALPVRRLRRRRQGRRRDRDLHGLADRPARDARAAGGRREDLPQPRRPGDPAGPRGAGAVRAPAERRPDPGGPPHPLRDGLGERGGAPARESGARRAPTPPGRRSTSSPTRSRRSPRTCRRSGATR